jgi:hypothetical protein
MTTTTSFMKSIDQILGDGRGRFFGHGYLKNTQIVSPEETVESGTNSGLTWRGGVQTAADWSIKDGVQQTPHLSTIDAVELSLQCVRSMATMASKVAGDADTLIKSIQIVAGNAPVDGDLSDIDIHGQLHPQQDDTSTLSLTIANMRVEIVLDPHMTDASNLEYPGKQPLSVSDILLHVDTSLDDPVMASGMAEPATPDSHSGWSHSSCFVAALQLGQALLYRLDGIDRANSNTLWMKRASFERLGSIPAFSNAQPIHVELRNVRRYNKPDGTWRRADIVGVIANRRVVCSVTHKLPAPQQQAS